jgi:hypothetical protein
MMDSKGKINEKRKYSRVADKVKFFYKSDFTNQKDWFIGWTSNLSLGGAFVKLLRPLPVGSRITIRLPLDFIGRGTTVCNFFATVVRHADQEAFGQGASGITFLQEGLENEKVVLSRYVRDKEQINISGEARVMVKAGIMKTEKKLENLMREAAREVDKGNLKKKGFLSRLFGKS